MPACSQRVGHSCKAVSQAIAACGLKYSFHHTQTSGMFTELPEVCPLAQPASWVTSRSWSFTTSTPLERSLKKSAQVHWLLNFLYWILCMLVNLIIPGYVIGNGAAKLSHIEKVVWILLWIVDLLIDHCCNWIGLKFHVVRSSSSPETPWFSFRVSLRLGQVHAEVHPRGLCHLVEAGTPGTLQTDRILLQSGF